MIQMQISEARRLAYELGLKKIEPLLVKLFAAEAQLIDLQERVEALEKTSSAQHMRRVEKRS